MGRPRSFDEAEVLQKAMNWFWAHGYEASSLDDLCCAMGIGRSSFYQAFGNKHALLLATLDRYGDIVLEQIAATFRPGRSFQDSLADFLAQALEAGGDCAGGRRGCYLGNCAAELAANDPEAAARLERTFTRIAQALAAQIREAQARGEIARDRNALALARLLMAGIQGLWLVAKASRNGAVLADIRSGLLQATC